MPLTERPFLQIIPNAGQAAGVFAFVLNAAMDTFNITTPARVVAFVAQLGHESANFTRLVKNLNYSVEALLS